ARRTKDAAAILSQLGTPLLIHQPSYSMLNRWIEPDLLIRRGQTLAQMALAWTLRDPRVTSTLIGASSVAQLEQNVGALDKLQFSAEELKDIDRYATESGINLWAASSAG